MAPQTQASPGVLSDRAYDFAGYRFRLLSNVETAADLAHDLLEPYKSTLNGADVPTYSMLLVPGKSHRYTFHREGECLLDESRAYPAAMVDVLMSDITRGAIKAQGEYLAVHASAASWKGRGLIMPAPTGSGKTTTVAGLVRAGFDYLSDEAALISRHTRMVHPFPRPLAMGTYSMSLVDGLEEDLPVRYHELMRRQHYYIPCDFLRSNSRGTPCPVKYVIAPSYSRGSATELQPIARGEVLALLAEQSFNLDRYGSQGLALLAEVVKSARCFRLQIGDLRSAVAQIKDLFTSDH